MKLFQYIPKILKRVLQVLLVLMLLFMAFPYLLQLNAHPQQFSERPFPESGYLKVSDTWVHYRNFRAEGDTVLGKIMLVHGFSGSTFSWRKSIPVLTKAGFFVSAIDLPPFGFSDKRRVANVTDSIWPYMIRAVMDSAEINQNTGSNPKWILAGHSMGGMVIGAFATNFPERTRAMVYVDGTSPDSDGKRSMGMKMSGWIMRMGFMQRWADVMMEHVLYSEKRFTELLRSAYGSDPTHEDVVGYMQPFSYYGSASSIFRFSSRAGYARVDKNILRTIPRFLIWGEKDAWIPVEGARKFLKDNPEIQSHFIPEAGHCPMETHPEEFNAKILEWIKSLPK